jgi:ribosome maturation factor RimP
MRHSCGAMMDVHDPISGEYALEVSSPGWDRPFFQLEQLPAYIGQQIAFRLISAVDNRRKFQAKLVAVDLEAEMIQVEVEKQQVLEIDSNNIDKANKKGRNRPNYCTENQYPLCKKAHLVVSLF